jgi:hypothetical protein
MLLTSPLNTLQTSPPAHMSLSALPLKLFVAAGSLPASVAIDPNGKFV